MNPNILIDMHNHLGVSPDGGESYLPDLLRNMDAYGIKKLILFAIDEEGAGPNFESVTARVIQAQRQYPRKFICFTRLVPGSGQAALEELERGLKAGIRGLKLKALDGYAVADTTGLLDRVKDIKGFIVLVHTDHREGSTPLDWETVIQQYPQLSFILAHGGKDRYRDCAAVVNRYPHVYVETSTLSYNRTKYLLRNVPIEKVLFASDYPYSHPAIERAKYEVLIHDNEDLQKVYYLNACRLLACDPQTLLTP